MPRRALFTEAEATDPGYVNIRAPQSRYLQAARDHCEQLWATFEPFADDEFLVEVRSNFDARYWEMYITVCLIELGYDVRCPKPGPDVGIIYEGKRIWFEATSPTRGAVNSADRVPELVAGEAQDVPNERLVLRYLNSISEKCLRQQPAWLRQGIVLPEDAFVVAINPRRLGFEFSDTEPPRILQAAFTIGNLYGTIDRNTREIVGTGYHFRDQISKSSGSPVSTGAFQREEFSGLSGLLCSRVDAANHPQTMGDDFQLVPNPHASVKLASTFRLPGTYFDVKKGATGYNVTPIEDS